MSFKLSFSPSCSDESLSSGLCSADTAPGGGSGQSDQGAEPSLPLGPPPCPGEGGVAAESCWAQAEPEHEHHRSFDI